MKGISQKKMKSPVPDVNVELPLSNPGLGHIQGVTARRRHMAEVAPLCQAETYSNRVAPGHSLHGIQSLVAWCFTPDLQDVVQRLRTLSHTRRRPVNLAFNLRCPRPVSVQPERVHNVIVPAASG